MIFQHDGLVPSAVWVAICSLEKLRFFANCMVLVVLVDAFCTSAEIDARAVGINPSVSLSWLGNGVVFVGVEGPGLLKKLQDHFRHLLDSVHHRGWNIQSSFGLESPPLFSRMFKERSLGLSMFILFYLYVHFGSLQNIGFFGQLRHLPMVITWS